MSGKKILFVVNDLSFFVSHRLPLAIEALSDGYQVHLATPSEYNIDFEGNDEITHHKIPLSRRGVNPFYELYSIIILFLLFRKVKPDIVHLVTVKPVLYGGIAARLARVKAVVAAVSGLGTVFISQKKSLKLLKVVVIKLYKISFEHKKIKIIFQNTNDQNIMIGLNLVSAENCILIKGSGVDLSQFKPSNVSSQPPTIIMASRLLKDKGVFEFVMAAKKVHEMGVKAKFILAGDIDKGNLSSLTNEDLIQINQYEFIEVIGFCKDINQLFSTVNIVVLPSYREGFPKVLIEAAACGKPIITTNVPGCIDSIVEGVTGLSVPVKDSDALSDAMKYLIENPDLCLKMGIKGRELAEQEYDIKQVVAKHMNTYSSLLQG